MASQEDKVLLVLCDRMFYIESTPGAREGATAGSADNSRQEPREHLEMQHKQPDGHLVRMARMGRRPVPEAAVSSCPTKGHPLEWGAGEGRISPITI